ncbi:MAG: thioesterase [Sphingobacteriales bacterium]|nr:MAG: thioesterase [Sphingobacteriales bacterium]
MTIFLFHHAGGDKYAFQSIEKQLQNRYQVIVYELPGRNYRLHEPLENNIAVIIEDTYNTLKEHLENNHEFVFIGLSMGALIAFLLAQKLQKEGKPVPKHIFLASRKSIEQYEYNEPVSQKSSAEFWDAVKYFGANIDGLLQHQELKDYYEPIIRNDFHCLEKFNRNYHSYTLPKLDIPISVLYGMEDKSIDEKGAYSWQQYCNKTIDVKSFNGGHFFLV